MLRRLPAALAVANLLGRIDPGDELLAVPLDHPRDPQTLGDVGADAKDRGHGGITLNTKDEG